MRGATHWNISLESFKIPVLLYKILIQMHPLCTNGAILMLVLQSRSGEIGQFLLKRNTINKFIFINLSCQ